jgi:RNA polymerase sigma-70 factor (ECF subfamily)
MDASFATSTFDLVERFRRGDEFAFSQLFTKYKPRLAVLIRYKLSQSMRERVEVDDILQEVFLEASKDIKGFLYRSPGSFMGWLSRIADHVIVDEARAHARQKRNAAEIVPFRSASNPGGPEPVDSTTPSRILVWNEIADRMVARLDALPPDYREAILLAKVEGLSSTEMAERMGKSREAAAVLLCRALQRFRKLSEIDNERRKPERPPVGGLSG